MYSPQSWRSAVQYPGTCLRGRNWRQCQGALTNKQFNCSGICLLLTRWGRNEIDTLFKCIFLNEIYWFRLKCHWSLFPSVQLTIFRHWSAPSHYLNQWCLLYWRLFALFGLNELSGYLLHTFILQQKMLLSVLSPLRTYIHFYTHTHSLSCPCMYRRDMHIILIHK